MTVAALLAGITLCGLTTTMPALAATTAPLAVATTYLPPGSANTSYSAQLTATGGTKPYDWTISSGALPAGLTLHPATGAITGKPTVTGTASFTVEVTDSESTPATVSASESITVTAPPLTVSTASLPTATADAPYSASLAATGGVSPYTWLLDGGALPTGLSLHGNGTLSGTPKVAGTFNFTAEVTDSDNPTETATASLSVTVAAAALVITTDGTLPTAQASTPYSVKLTADGGITPYTWSVASGDLPYGVTLKKTGVISGTPTGTGTYSVTVQVTDSENPPATASQALTLTVAVPLAITTTSLPGGTTGANYSASLTAAGGVAPYTWSLASGSSLPAGLAVNPGGTISGTVGGLAGSYPFTVEAADSENPAVTATESLTITVSTAPLSITTTSLPDATVDQAYSATLTATGGVGPYTWSLVSGSPPEGLSLNTSTGVISGTELAGPGPDSILVEVFDSEDPAVTAEKTVAIDIDPSPVPIIGTRGPLTAQAGTSYSQGLLATGGVAPYTWSVASGSSLPAGLSIGSSTGVISGTPQQPGTYTFTIQAADSQNPPATGDLAYTMTVTPAPVLNITTTSLPTAVAGTSYSATLTATGGVAPYTWTLASGSSLPAGLTLDSSTGVITGTVGGPAGSDTVTFEAADAETPAQDAGVTFTMTVESPITFPGSASVPDGSVGDIYSFTLTAEGGIAPYTWSLASGSSLPAGLTVSPGGTISGTVGGSAGFYTFTVEVTDATPQTATETLTMTVESSITFPGSGSLPDGIVGQSYSAALTENGGIAPYTWSFAGGSLPPGLTVNPSGSVTGTVGDAPGSYTFTAAVTDATGLTTGETLTIDVLAPVSVATTSLPDAVAGASYNAPLTATGGTTPYTWSLFEGLLPPGLAVNPNGSITGTVTASSAGESFPVTIKATDAESPAQTATANFTISVEAPFTIDTAMPASTTPGDVWNYMLTVITGPGPGTWSLVSGSSLPPGLSLDSSGNIYGSVADDPGSYTFTVEVKDAVQSATATFTITVAPSLTITTTSLPTAEAENFYQSTLTATGGVGAPYAWSFVSGTLPPGLTVNENGIITGRVADEPGSYTFTVEAEDSETPAQTATATFTMTVEPQLTIATTSLPEAEVVVGVNTFYGTDLSATGGLGPYTWTFVSGTLPPGLSLDQSTGEISGEINTVLSQTYQFEVSVTDSLGVQASATLEIQVQINI
jgi:hypothetical protein